MQLFDFLRLLQGLAEEVNVSPIGFSEGNILAIFSEDFTHRKAFFVSNCLGQRVLENIASIVETTHIFGKLIVIVRSSNNAIEMFNDMVNRLVDESRHAGRLPICHVLLHLPRYLLERYEERDVL